MRRQWLPRVTAAHCAQPDEAKAEAPVTALDRPRAKTNFASRFNELSSFKTISENISLFQKRKSCLLSGRRRRGHAPHLA
jgi:hypothetical protein